MRTSATRVGKSRKQTRLRLATARREAESKSPRAESVDELRPRGVVALKEQMLSCHRSQLARSQGKDFAPLADLMRQQYQSRRSQSGVSAAEAFRAHHAFKRVRAW